MSEDSDSDIVKDFLVGSYENLDRTWSAWRKTPMIGMRCLACFVPSTPSKAPAAFWVSPNWRRLCTFGESLLTRLRDGQLTLNPQLTTALLGMVDAVRQMLGSIEVSGAEGERDDTQLIATLTRLQQSPEAPVKSAVVAVPEPSSDAAELSSSIGDLLIQRDRVTELLDIPAILRKANLKPARIGRAMRAAGAKIHGIEHGTD
jgi:two-component system chemotaxis sensor kinase CheA